MKKILFFAFMVTNVVLSVTTAIAQYGTITTVAGGSGWASFAGDGGPATASTVSFARTTGVCTDTAGDIFIYDMMNSRIRKVNHATNILTTIAGNGTSGYTGDGGPGQWQK